MEFHFKHTRWEIICFTVKVIVTRLIKSKMILRLFSAMALLRFCLALLFEKTETSIIVVLLECLIFALVVSMIITFSMCFFISASVWGKIFGKERDICIRDGVIFSGTAEKSNLLEIPCRNVKSAKVSGPLIWLELPFDKTYDTYVLIPVRVFGSKEERQQFLDFFKKQQELEPIVDPEKVRQNQPIDWDVEFDMGADRWVSANIQVITIVRSRLFGKTDADILRNRLRLIIFALLAMMAILHKENGDAKKLIYIGLGYLSISLIRKKQSVSKAKMYKQLERKGQKIDELGYWKIYFREAGIDCEYSDEKRYLTWKELKYLVESGEWFFLFASNGQVKLFFEKSLLTDDNRREDFVNYCKAHGLEYKQSN